MLTKLVGAGVMLIAALAALAGVYQMATQTALPPVAPVRDAAVAADTPRVATPAMLEADAEAKRVIAQHRAAMAGKVKCVDGVLFAIETDAWTNVGTC